jgi:signal transduction histidine kinase
MIPLSPKTVRGKLLIAYLAVVAIFICTGIFVIVHLNALHDSSSRFFRDYAVTDDLIISARFTVDEIRNTVLLPPATLNPEVYASVARKSLEDLAAQFKFSALPEDMQKQAYESILGYGEVVEKPLKMRSGPIARMQEADAVAELCMRQAEKMHNPLILNAVAGIVDTYTDILLTNDPDERGRFADFIKVVEQQPGYRSIESFPLLKEKALLVFTTNEEYVGVVERFKTTSRTIASELADIDKFFHSEFLLPGQERLSSYASRSVWLVVLALLFSVFIATVVSLLLAKRIWRPLLAMKDMVARMSDGDLNHRLSVNGEDEVASIVQSLNRFADQLKGNLEQMDKQMHEMAFIETDLRKSEEYNRTLSKEYQFVLDGISESLVVVNRERAIVWSNKKASDEMYAEIDKKVSSEEYEISPSSAYYLGSEQVDICFNTGDNVEELIRLSEGAYFRVKVFPLLDENGEVSRVLKVVNDVSDQFLLKEEAERSNRLASLGELSAGVAHEINNPNSLVIINSPIVRDVFEDVMPILEDHYTEHGDFMLGGLSYLRLKYDLPLMLKEMHEGGMRIQRIVEDLKSFVRKDDPMSLEKIDLNISVETSLRLTRNLIKKTTDNLVLNLRKRLPLIKGNAVSLEQVAVNLIQNACLALPDRSRKLTIATDISDDGESVMLIVKDEGVGIDEESLKRITDPFFTTRRKEGGTGLGLSVSSRLVRDLDGQMFFDSKPDEGMTVTVRFPIVKYME